MKRERTTSIRLALTITVLLAMMTVLPDINPAPVPFLTAAIAAEADKAPFDDYQAPGELVTLSAKTTLEVAFAILNQVAMSMEGVVIVDPNRHDGTVGVSLTQQPWRKALHAILKANSLWYREEGQTIEIIEIERDETPGREDLDRTCRDVKIEAVFFEADREYLKESGIDWSTVKNGLVEIGAEVFAGSSVAEPMFEGYIDGTTEIGGFTLDVKTLFRILQNHDKGEIIAQPVIVVRDGKSGRIQVGQDFSIKSRDYAGNVIDNFFSTGTILEVSPKLYQDGDLQFIHLDISVERSSASPDVVSTVVNKVQANSSILLLSGESTVIGGLYSTIREVTRKGVPGLKDLPPWVLGLRYLFGHNRVSVKHQELVILLSAELLSPLDDRSDSINANLQEHLDRVRQGLNDRFQQNVTETTTMYKEDTRNARWPKRNKNDD